MVTFLECMSIFILPDYTFWSLELATICCMALSFHDIQRWSSGSRHTTQNLGWEHLLKISMTVFFFFFSILIHWSRKRTWNCKFTLPSVMSQWHQWRDKCIASNWLGEPASAERSFSFCCSLSSNFQVIRYDYGQNLSQRFQWYLIPFFNIQWIEWGEKHI